MGKGSRWKGEAHMCMERARCCCVRGVLRCGRADCDSERFETFQRIGRHSCPDWRAPTINQRVQVQVDADGARQQHSTQRGAELCVQGVPLHQGLPGPPVFQPRPLRHRRRLRAARRAHVRGARGRVRAAAKGQHQTLPRRLPQGTLANYRCIH